MDIKALVLKQVNESLASSNMTVTVDNDTPLTEYGIDSLKAITILFGLEDALGIEISNEAVDSVRTVNDIITVVSGLVDSDGGVV